MNRMVEFATSSSVLFVIPDCDHFGQEEVCWSGDTAGNKQKICCDFVCCEQEQCCSCKIKHDFKAYKEIRIVCVAENLHFWTPLTANIEDKNGEKKE